MPISKCFSTLVNNYKVEVNRDLPPRCSSTPACVPQLGDQKKICLGWDLNPRPPLPDAGTVTTTEAQWLSDYSSRVW